MTRRHGRGSAGSHGLRARRRRWSVWDESTAASGGDQVTAVLDPPPGTRQVFFHDPKAPVAGRVVPSVFVAVQAPDGSLLLVRRCDSGRWELPGGRVDVGENACETAVREVAEETGLQVTVTGVVGLFTDPGHVVRAIDGDVRQQFAVVFRARAAGGEPRADRHETSEAAWVAPADLPELPMEPPVRDWVARAVAIGEPFHLG
jgi:8-oxo-dGTP diphosphatase